jgi:hypothetical protein
MALKLTSLSWQNLEKLQIDERENLYWDGRRVSTQVGLRRFELFLVVMTAASTFVMALLDVLRYFNLDW